MIMVSFAKVSILMIDAQLPVRNVIKCLLWCAEPHADMTNEIDEKYKDAIIGSIPLGKRASSRLPTHQTTMRWVLMCAFPT